MQLPDLLNFDVLVTSLVGTIVVTLVTALVRAWHKNAKMQNDMANMKKKITHLEDVRITKIENDFDDIVKKQTDVLQQLGNVAKGMTTVETQVNTILNHLLNKKD